MGCKEEILVLSLHEITCRRYGKMSDPLDLAELQVVVSHQRWVMGIQLKSSASACSLPLGNLSSRESVLHSVLFVVKSL